MRRTLMVLLPLALAAATVQAAVPSIGSGTNRSCSVNAAGAVACWGDNQSGALGNGEALQELTAVQVTGLTSGVVSLSAGAFHTCAAMNTGRVMCWGENANGQLGTGSITNSTVPSQVVNLTDAVQVAAGAWHTCALRATGTVVCWGFNLGGELGNGGQFDSFVPVNVSNLTGVTTIAAGQVHTCALRNDGEVRCWGDNGYGQLGNGTNATGRTPVAANLPAARAISGGLLHTCAVTTAGAAMCWGRNDWGQVGNNSTTHINTPAPVSGLSSGVTSIAAGEYHSCALTTTGAVRCWGNNDYGELGNGTTTSTLVPAPVVSGLPTDVVSIVTGLGSLHSCAVTSSRSAFCWGANDYGQLGDGTQSERHAAVRSTAAGSAAAAVVTGAEHTCALSTGGAVSCWGGTSTHQLGNGKMIGIPTPAPVVGLGSGMTQVASGNFHTCAVASSGRVSCWGSGGAGQLGNNSGLSTSRPVTVQGITNAVAVTAGGFHSCALLATGGVTCWGHNDNRQVDDTTNTSVFLPFALPALSSGVVAITAGEVYTCALTSAGAVYCWGGNDHGQLGGSSSRTPVTGMTSGIRAISAGASHTCALTAAGGVLCIGENSGGGLGNGTYADSPTPVAVTGLSSGITAISVGRFHSCALTVSQAVMCWGYNAFGQLGDGTTTDSAVPVAVAGLASGVVAIAAGAYHTCALIAGGDVRCWGYNSPGAAGDGTFAVRPKAAVVVREGGAGSIAAGDWYLDLDPAAANSIPASATPAYLAKASGNATTAIVDVNAAVQFRAQDAGRPIYVYGYVPTSLVRAALLAKDEPVCVLAQIDSSGQLLQVSASSMQSYVGGVVSAGQQAVSVLSSVPSPTVAGGTFCVGTGTTAEQSVAVANSQCVATVPASQVCSPPAATTSGGASLPGALSGLWWNPAESGWGIDFTQRGRIVFAAWYTYDAAGNPKWYVAPRCELPAAASAGTCSESLYEVTGPRFFNVPFDTSAVRATVAGSLRLTFQSAAAGSMTYTVAGQTRTVAISRQTFPGGTVAPPIDYTDLWWNPAESGWGMAVAHKFANMFLAWYVYDSSGRPVWYVASNCAVGSSPSACSGTLYRTTGPGFGPTFDASQVRVFETGTVSIAFTNGDNGIITYTVDGVTATKAITRQLF